MERKPFDHVFRILPKQSKPSHHVFGYTISAINSPCKKNMSTNLPPIYTPLRFHHLVHCTFLRMQLQGHVLLFSLTILVSVLFSSFVSVQAAATYRNDSSDSPLSPWLDKVANHGHHHGYDPRDPGCRRRPWICRRDEDSDDGRGFQPRKRCCRNRCIDVSSDVNHCGWCGRRCPFAWKCCRGFCRNINVNPFNCGRCGNKCPFGVRCFFGICGYGEPYPPKPKKGKKGKQKRKGEPSRDDDPPGMDEISFTE